MHPDISPALIASTSITAAEVIASAPWSAVLANIIVTLCVAVCVSLVRNFGRRD